VTKNRELVVLGAVAAFALLAALVLADVTRTVDAAPAPKFQAGETYLFVWDCLPMVLMPVGVNPETGETTRANPCYVETLTVRTVYDDGWLDAVDPDDVAHRGKDALVWRINPSRAISITPQKNQARRAA